MRDRLEALEQLLAEDNPAGEVGPRHDPLLVAVGRVLAQFVRDGTYGVSFPAPGTQPVAAAGGYAPQPGAQRPTLQSRIRPVVGEMGGGAGNPGKNSPRRSRTAHRGGPLMSADEKRKLLALRAEMGRLAAEIAIARAGAVLAAEIRRLDAGER